MLIKNKLIKASLMLGVAVSISMLGFGASASALDAAWGPVRDTYTLESPAPEPIFNSITNNHNTESPVDPHLVDMSETLDYSAPGQVNNTPSTEIGLGDERNFVRIREADSDKFFDDIVEAEPGKEYEVYVYYHNNASPSLPEEVSWAYNTRLKVEAPEKVKKGQTAVIKGTITWNKENAEDADTFNVWDTTFLKATDEIYLRYVPNSAVIHNGNTRGTTANGKILSAEALWGDVGAFLAYDTSIITPDDPNTEENEEKNMWGIIPACNEFAGYVTFRLKADQPKFYMEKEVSLDGKKDWTDTIKAAPGDTLHFRIHYKNVGTTQQDDVNASDNLPAEMIYETIKDAAEDKDFEVRLVSLPIGAEQPTVDTKIKLSAKDFFGEKGVTIGNYEPNTEFYIYYDVKVADAEKFTECTANIWNKAQLATANGTMFDKVKVTVIKDCKLPDTGSDTKIIAISVVLGGACCVYLACMIKGFRSKKA